MGSQPAVRPATFRLAGQVSAVGWNAAQSQVLWKQAHCCADGWKAGGKAFGVRGLLCLGGGAL